MLGSPQVLTMIKTYNVKGTETTNVNFSAPSVSANFWMQSCLQQQSDMLHTITSAMCMPKPEILSFYGKPIEYWKFIKNFETNVQSKVPDDSIKLSYLIQYCHGEARESIEDCVVLPPTDGYFKARDILNKRYGRPHVIAHAYMDELKGGPNLHDNDAAGLMALSMLMQRCEMTLLQMGYTSDLNSTDNILMIQEKLPKRLRGQWVERSDQIIESGSEPSFRHLVRFIEDNARSANNLYGRALATASAQHKKPQYQDKSISKNSYSMDKRTTLATSGSHDMSNKETGYHGNVGQNSDASKCIMCQGQHELSKCRTFISMTYYERKQVIEKHMLCFNCFTTGHYARGCMQRSMCDFCTWKHHTLVHPPQRGQNEKQVNKERDRRR